MTTAHFRWRCDPVQPDAPAAPVPPVTRWYRCELPPVDANEYIRVWEELAAVPVDAIQELYDAYAHAVAGMDNAAEFPTVGKWLGVLHDEVVQA